MAQKRNPARLVIALSVAAVLAVFLLYTSIAGGGTPSVAPSELAGNTGVVTLVGHVVGRGSTGDSYGSGLRFSSATATAPADDGAGPLHGHRSPTFPGGPRGLRQGQLRNGVFVAKHGLARDEVPVEVHGQEELG